MAFNLARRAALSAPRVLGRRGLAEVASDNSRLRLSLTIFKSQDVVQVNLAAESGDLGVLANHVPSIEALKPGVLEVIEGSANESKKWFVSGGFANVHPNNTLTVNAVEAYPLDAFSPEAIRTGLAEAQRVAGGSGTEEEKAEAQIEVQVYEALQNALKA
ncbi:epsilon subunit of F1F0-ATP synthase N-terminal domain-containing protein [Rhodotorula diobovata]|uniref:ATP synthase subunit delta, mitochondrial n=1 Tax=Rhodotorula diobovata TaxID=5288 RepID=A0A5C5FQF7_9BASI|nr:epsilon subunit of F1F0-ATP synthase N-terminal domain-containing protein [Rhodotorula diobovata]